MADKRINALTTTSASVGDDYFAIDGATNGTRALSAFSPTFGGNATVGGTLTVSGNLDVASGISTAAAQLQIGNARTGSGYAIVDLVGDTTYTDYGTRIIRGNSGANATSSLEHRGTGDLSLVATDAAAIKFYTNGNLAATVAATTGNTTIHSTTASTSTSSGALVVSGGVGVGGNINAGGYLRSINSSAANGSEFTALRADVGADGTLGAALVTIGALPSATAASRYGFITCYDNGDWRTLYLGGSPGVAANGGQVRVPANIASTSTSSGALVVSGGVGVAGNAYVGGALVVSGGIDNTIAGNVQFSTGQIRVTNAYTPLSASAAGAVGSITWDNLYIYVCVATNTWKRVAISSW